jgi:hypothetical protein
MSTPRGAIAPPPEPVRVAQEVHHLDDLPLDPLVAGHVGEPGRGPLGVEHLGAGPTHRPIAPTCPPARRMRKTKRAIEQQERREREQHGSQRDPGRQRLDLHAFASSRASSSSPLSSTGIAVVNASPSTKLPSTAPSGVIGHRLHTAVIDRDEELAVGQLICRAVVHRAQDRHEPEQDRHHEQPTPPLGR